MASASTNQQWLLAAYPAATPSHADFKLVDAPAPTCEPGHVVVRTTWISVDPYMRGRMSPVSSYTSNYIPDQPITGILTGVVVESQAAGFAVGDHITTFSGPWATYFAIPAAQCTKIDVTLAKPSDYIGVLGITGLSAYFPIEDYADAKPGDVAFVSAAAGGVGSIAGQLLKLKGCTVIGSAGTDEKVEWLKELGFDHAFNYRTRSTADALAEYAPAGVDIYFDNVGGQTLDETLLKMKTGGRILACGAISQYNTPREEQYGLKNTFCVITKQLRWQGFLLPRWRERFGEGITALATLLKGGKLRARETVVDGFEHTPAAFIAMLKGHNMGKTAVRVSGDGVTGV